MASKKRGNNRYRYEIQVDGTAARKAVVVPRNPGRSYQRAGEGKRAKNRSRALLVGRGYVLFLTVMAIACLTMCIHYVRLKETVTSQMENNAELSSTLTTLQSENAALKENITNSIDWEYVKNTAINDLGMSYATEDQVIWYNIQNSGYVRQYEAVDGE